MRHLTIGLLLMAVVATSCKEETTPDRDSRILARVGNKTLAIDEMEGMFPIGITRKDSQEIIANFVDRWVKDAAVLNEAEKNIPPDFNINKLVRDYRASLLRTHYEKVLVEELLDSLVTAEELKAFYETNKQLYELQLPIVRCYFIKVPLPVPESGRLRELWNNYEQSSSLAQLKEYCGKFATVSLLNDSLWYAVDEVASQLPEGTLTAGNISSKREFTQQDGHNQYFFRLFEVRNRQEIAPLSYVEEQARKVILHKRKLQLIEKVKEDIYQKELEENNIETFIEQ
ncbi:MAG: hypothetical protein R2795_10175 [Saprospiraceae bacterium]